jgi:primase-polymerase (primpol)-like protein
VIAAETRPAPPSVAFDEAGIPPELKELDHWLLWGPVWDAERERWTKPPLDPDAPEWALREDSPEARKAGRMGSSTDRTKWTHVSYAIVRARKLQLGIGFGLSEDVRVIGVDIDHCIGEDGQLKPWAQAIVEALDTYAEVSPSGTGIRAFAFGAIPKALMLSPIGLELYSTGRYLTVTGRRLPGSPQHVLQRDAEIREVYAQFAAGFARAAPKEASGTPRSTVANLSDREVVDRIARSRQGEKFRRVYAGDVSGYASASEADMALACIVSFWSHDPTQVERILRSSGLQRAKWDTSRPGGSYLSVTIANAIERGKKSGRRREN